MCQLVNFCSSILSAIDLNLLKIIYFWHESLLHVCSFYNPYFTISIRPYSTMGVEESHNHCINPPMGSAKMGDQIKVKPLLSFNISLQTLNTISAEKNSTIVFPLPIDMITYFMRAKEESRM